VHKISRSDALIKRWIDAGFSGGGKLGALSFAGNVFYSYRTPIVSIMTDKILGVLAVECLRTKSCSTSRHQNKVSYMLRTQCPIRFLYCYDDVLVGPCHGKPIRSWEFKDVERQALGLLVGIEQTIRKIPKCVKLSSFNSYRSQIGWYRERVVFYTDVMMDARQRKSFFGRHIKPLDERVEKLVSDERVDDLRIKEVCRKL